MKYKIKTAEKLSRIPEIGEVWRHKDCSELWMRIDPEKIDKNFGHNGAFYSVSLNTGEVQWTSKESRSFEVSSSIAEFEF